MRKPRPSVRSGLPSAPLVGLPATGFEEESATTLFAMAVSVKASSLRPVEQEALWRPRWRTMAGLEAADNRALVAECVDLYGDHYGRWGDGSDKPGERVRISEKAFLERISDDNVWVACAFKGSQLIGYCV